MRAASRAVATIAAPDRALTLSQTLSKQQTLLNQTSPGLAVYMLPSPDGVLKGMRSHATSHRGPSLPMALPSTLPAECCRAVQYAPGVLMVRTKGTAYRPPARERARTVRPHQAPLPGHLRVTPLQSRWCAPCWPAAVASGSARLGWSPQKSPEHRLWAQSSARALRAPSRPRYISARACLPTSGGDFDRTYKCEL